MTVHRQRGPCSHFQIQGAEIRHCDVVRTTLYIQAVDALPRGWYFPPITLNKCEYVRNEFNRVFRQNVALPPLFK